VFRAVLVVAAAGYGDSPGDCALTGAGVPPPHAGALAWVPPGGRAERDGDRPRGPCRPWARIWNRVQPCRSGPASPATRLGSCGGRETARKRRDAVLVPRRFSLPLLLERKAWLQWNRHGMGSWLAWPTAHVRSPVPTGLVGQSRSLLSPVFGRVF
jgi:hypothetical protein